MASKLRVSVNQRLSQEVKRLGMQGNKHVRRLLQTDLSVKEKLRRLKAIALLDSWVKEGDAQEQKETWEFLVKALDEDRSSYRKLFPPELKGISW